MFCNNRIFLALCFFLVVVLSTSTPATAAEVSNDRAVKMTNILSERALVNAGGFIPTTSIDSSKNPTAVSLEVRGDKIVAKVQLRGECFGRYSIFANLQKYEVGQWNNVGDTVPLNLGDFDPNKELNLKSLFSFPFSGDGVYRLNMAQWIIGRDDNSCKSKIGTSEAPTTNSEWPYVVVGNITPTQEMMNLLPVARILNVGALGNGILEFPLFVPSRAKVMVYQEFGTDKTVSKTEDFNPQPGTFLVQTRVPTGFRPGLPIRVHIQLETGVSASYTIYSVDPAIRLLAEPHDLEWQ